MMPKLFWLHLAFAESAENRIMRFLPGKCNLMKWISASFKKLVVCLQHLKSYLLGDTMMERQQTSGPVVLCYMSCSIVNILSRGLKMRRTNMASRRWGNITKRWWDVTHLSPMLKQHVKPIKLCHVWISCIVWQKALTSSSWRVS